MSLTNLPRLLVGCALGAWIAARAAGPAAPAGPTLEPSLAWRLGYDTNPVATHGVGAAALGGQDAWTASLGAGLATSWGTAGGGGAGKLSYLAERNVFDGWAAENFTTHRLAAAWNVADADGKLAIEASTLFVDGSRDTLTSIAGCNANATALWRERRAQWQHRAKLAAERTLAGGLVLRGSGSLLDYDYRTREVAGRVPFVDRRDAWVGVDLGRRDATKALWFGGVRIGRQEQATTALPGGGFDYSSRGVRVVGGWEGKLGPATTASVAIGPDFRHFDGAVDPAVFAGRDRVSLWWEANVNSKLSARWTVNARTGRWVWLSSSGKSAYTDNCLELGATAALDARTSLRFSGKLHGCAYFPAVRNDWEGFAGVGVTRKVGARAQLTVDALYHAGWNGLGWLAEREFSRFILQTGGSVRF